MTVVAPRRRSVSRLVPRRRRWEGIAVDLADVDADGVARAVSVWCIAPDEDRARAILEQVAGGPVLVMREQVYW